MVQLKKILRDVHGYVIRGSQEVSISGISLDSKKIEPGNLFIAKKGRSHDGNHYLDEAIKNGAVAIVTDCFEPSLKNVVQIIHSNISEIESTLINNFFENPSNHLLVVGITGTNGKTTTTFIIKSLLDYFIGSCGLIGTIEYIIGEKKYPAKFTTPDVVTNHKLLREMVKDDCKAVVMEVSSHGLNQERVAKIDFDIAIFSNLTIDHLDYHGTIENYAACKKRFFDQLGKQSSNKKMEKWAIVNQDSPWSSYMTKDCEANILTYGIEKFADLQATEIVLESHGTKAKICYQGQTKDCFWPLVGRFNVYNCLAAMAAVLVQGIAFERVVKRMSEIPFVRGRLQPVKNKLGLNIYVDFAHTGDALANSLQTLGNIISERGKLIVVFGCGGDRDPLRRTEMAKAGELYADICIVTSDNPRSEDPKKICSDIMSGFAKPDRHIVELDRTIAIKRAIEMANHNDIILIAGKGHESYQIFADRTIEFDDCQVATQICSELSSFCQEFN